MWRWWRSLPRRHPQYLLENRPPLLPSDKNMELRGLMSYNQQVKSKIIKWYHSSNVPEKSIRGNLFLFLYLLRVSTSLHELGDRHAACALPFVGGWRCGGRGLGCSGRVSLRACGCLGFFTGLFSSSCGEVGPLTGHGKSFLAKTGQDLRVHIPAAASVGGALLVNSVALHEALHLYPDEGKKKKKVDLQWLVETSYLNGWTRL